MILLCRTRRRWRRRLPEILRDELFYVSIASLGHELVQAVIRGDAGPARRAFGVIERCLAAGNADTTNLMVVGLFEAMQNDAHARLEPPDALDDWLGPRSRGAWADLIEGWTGKGIRTIEQWRRVVVNGWATRVTWEGPDLRWTIERVGPGARLDLVVSGVASSRLLAAAHTEAIFARFSPLLALRILAPGEASSLTHGLLHVAQPHTQTHLRLGDQAGEGRIASDGSRWFLLDPAVIAAAEAWSSRVTAAGA
jgi:hypothetical protein